MELGFDINTGEPITLWSKRLVHVGLGYYQPADTITKEDLTRRQRFFASLDAELSFTKLGMEES